MPHSHLLLQHPDSTASTTLPPLQRLSQNSLNQLVQVHDLRAPCSSPSGRRYHVQNLHIGTNQHCNLHQDAARHSGHPHSPKARSVHPALHQALALSQFPRKQRHHSHNHDPIQETIPDLDSSMKVQRLHQPQEVIWQEAATALLQVQESVLDLYSPLSGDTSQTTTTKKQNDYKRS